MYRSQIEPSDRIFLKGSDFLSFAKNITKNIGKNNRKIIK